MEKKVRALLLRILGFEKYLSLVSDIYIRMVRAGLMRKKYPELFYLKEIVKPGFVCVDIGANVGYYSSFLSVFAGRKGKVLAVEPVALFAQIFRRNTAHFGLENITLYETALGGENGKVLMGTPVIDGVLRHGLTSVVAPEEAVGLFTYEVPLQVPDELFANLTRFDFLKCDVEGYEVYLFPHFMKTLERFKPLIQIEISTRENREKILHLLSPLGYVPQKLSGGNLVTLSTQEALDYEKGDFYFKANA
jgi:FkbM family methyltransferase